MMKNVNFYFFHHAWENIGPNPIAALTFGNQQYILLKAQKNILSGQVLSSCKHLIYKMLT